MIANPVFACCVLLAVAGGDATGGECRHARDRHQIALGEVGEALSAYRTCIAAGGRDACTAEFNDLDLAQALLEEAAADYAVACRTKP